MSLDCEKTRDMSDSVYRMYSRCTGCQEIVLDRRLYFKNTLFKGRELVDQETLSKAKKKDGKKEFFFSIFFW